MDLSKPIFALVPDMGLFMTLNDMSVIKSP